MRNLEQGARIAGVIALCWVWLLGTAAAQSVRKDDFRINDESFFTTIGEQDGPDIAASMGGYTVVWQDGRIVGRKDVYAQLYDATGVAIGTAFRVNDDTSAPSDILYVIDCLNGVRTCDDFQCDVDRSLQCGPPDILRVIDLLNGAGQYAPWLNKNMPISCPSP